VLARLIVERQQILFAQARTETVKFFHEIAGAGLFPTRMAGLKMAAAWFELCSQGNGSTERGIIRLQPPTK